MRNRTVADVMTTKVVAVVAETPFRDVVRALEYWRVSGVPVVDADRRVIGVVSESDLLCKHEFRGPQERPLVERRLTRLARAKAAASSAGALMTAPAITVRPEDTVVSAARVLANHGIKRAPVVAPDGQLVGIVTRSDLLLVFLRPDLDIAADVARWLRSCGLAAPPADWAVRCHKGVVTLTGQVVGHDQVARAAALAEEVDGVVDVVNELAAVRAAAAVSGDKP